MQRRSLLSRLAFLPLVGAAASTASEASGQATDSGLTQAAIGAALHPQSDAERTQGISPVNYNYPEMNVMRYGATGDGSADDSRAFQSAFNVAKVRGGTVYIPPPSVYYLIRSPLDLTPTARHVAGFQVKMAANPHFSANSPNGAILLDHTGIGFDCTGNNALQFADLCLASRADTVPKVAILCARNSSGASVVHRFNNCRVFGYFSVAVYYNYGCEDDQLVGCYFHNYYTRAGSKTVVITASNIFALTSPHTAIYSGSISTSHHHFCGGNYGHAGGHSSADVFYLDVCTFLHLERLWVACERGRAIVYCDSTHGPSSSCTIFGMQVENGAAPAQGIVMPNPGSGTANIVDWVIDASYFSNVSSAILAAGTAVSLSSFKLRGLSSLHHQAIVISGTAAYCTFDCDATPVVIGTAQQCILMGSVQNFTLTVNNKCCFVDARPSRNWVPDTSSMRLQPAGTIAVSAVNSNVMGNQVEVTFTMQASSAMYCEAGTLISGLPFAPKNGRGGIVSVTDGTSDIAIGLGHINTDGIHLPAIASAGSPTSHAICVTARYFIA
jgi:hypothetical protein